nr:MAG TPA: hypothetical protein [Caudoviricetes sp.]
MAIDNIPNLAWLKTAPPLQMAKLAERGDDDRKCRPASSPRPGNGTP